MLPLKGIICAILTVFLYVNVNAQVVLITGKVIGADNIENIHVINKTSNRFTITNSKGVFSIEAKLKDTIAFTGIQYKTTEVIVDATILLNKSMNVYLEEDVNELNEVVVGQVLTGNLMEDIGNSTITRDINFYDVGIPGYMGKPKTSAERRLNIATTGDLDPLINAISGRTKMLKHHIDLERNSELITKIKEQLSEDFFKDHNLNETKQMEFWYFCAEDPNFWTRCNEARDIEILAFLNEKYLQYTDNLNATSN